MGPTRQGTLARRRLRRGALIRVPAVVLGVWAADRYVPGLSIGGTTPVRLLVCGAVAAVSLVTGLLLGILVAALGAWAAQVVTERVSGRQCDPAGPRPLAGYLLAVGIHVVNIAAVLPVAFWAGTGVCRVAGAPIELSGGWASYLAVSLVSTGVWGAALLLRPPRAQLALLRRWAASRITYAAVAGVLWLATGYVDGVQLVRVSAEPAVAGVLVTAAALSQLRPEAGGRWGALGQGPVDVLAVWALSQLGDRLAGPLTFGGAGSLVLTALAITAVTLPVRLLADPPVATWGESEIVRS
jgi:hypothetical protein